MIDSPARAGLVFRLAEALERLDASPSGSLAWRRADRAASSIEIIIEASRRLTAEPSPDEQALLVALRRRHEALRRRDAAAAGTMAADAAALAAAFWNQRARDLAVVVYGLNDLHLECAPDSPELRSDVRLAIAESWALANQSERLLQTVRAKLRVDHPGVRVISRRDPDDGHVVWVVRGGREAA